jgi:hypothetical protein
LETQVRVQQWFDKTDAPFVGIIVAPYYNGNRTLASNYKLVDIFCTWNIGGVIFVLNIYFPQWDLNIFPS